MVISSLLGWLYPVILCARDVLCVHMVICGDMKYALKLEMTNRSVVISSLLGWPYPMILYEMFCVVICDMH